MGKKQMDMNLVLCLPEIRVLVTGEDGCGYMERHVDRLAWRDFCLVVHSLIGTLPVL